MTPEKYLKNSTLWFFYSFKMTGIVFQPALKCFGIRLAHFKVKPFAAFGGILYQYSTYSLTFRIVLGAITALY
jgi:hypothetical protein